MIRFNHVLLGLTVLCSLATLSCSKSEAGGAKKPRIGFAMTLNDPYWESMQIGARAEADKLGATVTILDAQEDVQKQAQEINDLIQQGVDAVCLVPMKPDGLVNSVRALNAAKIPVIIVNRQIGDGCDYVTYTGTDVYEGGVTSAKILMKAMGGKGEVAEFQQILGTGPQIARTKALADVMKDFPDVKLVAQIPHEGDNDKVVAAVGTLLSKYPNLKGLYVHGDPQALAASQACVAAGRKDIAIVGMGGSDDAIAAIKAGTLAGTSYQQPKEEGRSAVELAIKALNGEKLEKSYPITCPAITKENADQFDGQF